MVVFRRCWRCGRRSCRIPYLAFQASKPPIYRLSGVLVFSFCSVNPGLLLPHCPGAYCATYVYPMHRPSKLFATDPDTGLLRAQVPPNQRWRQGNDSSCIQHAGGPLTPGCFLLLSLKSRDAFFYLLPWLYTYHRRTAYICRRQRCLLGDSCLLKPRRLFASALNPLKSRQLEEERHWLEMISVFLSWKLKIVTDLCA